MVVLMFTIYSFPLRLFGLSLQELSKGWTRDEELHIEEIPVEYRYVQENIPKLWKLLNPKVCQYFS